MDTDLSKLADEFAAQLAQSHGKKAVENYTRYLRRFFLQSGVRAPRDITEAVVRRYGAYLNTHVDARGARLSAQTKNYHRIALRAFLKYLHARGVSTLPYRKVKLEQFSRARTAPFKKADTALLSGAVAGTNEAAVRDRALLQVLRATNLRVGELCKLNVADVDGSRLRTHTSHGVPKVVTLPREAADAIIFWLAVRHSADPALFLNVGRHAARSGSLRLTPRSVQRIVKHYAEQAGLRGVTPERLRRVV